MPEPVTILAPAGYVPELAIAFGAPGTLAMPVTPAQPLPVAQTRTASAIAPLAGTAGAGMTVGPFVPELGRPIWLTLAGTWTGRATLLRSIDGGATLLPLTAGGRGWGSFTANANEPVAEESVAGAGYYLQIAVASGTLAYRVSQ